MRRISILLVALLGLVAFSFSQENYTMFENTYLHVKSDMYKEFGKAMAEHNQKFHSDGPYHANVWTVSTGIYAGTMVWSMGPCTFTHLDSRPGGKEHVEDWLYNVMPTIKSVKETGYWKLADKLSYTPKDSLFTKLMITVYDLEPWQGYRFKEIIKKVVEVYETKELENSFSVYYPQTSMAKKRDVAIVWGFKKYADLDKDLKFKEDFEEIHGEGSWASLMDEYKAIVVDSVDEIWELIPELGGSYQE